MLFTKHSKTAGTYGDSAFAFNTRVLRYAKQFIDHVHPWLFNINNNTEAGPTTKLLLNSNGMYGLPLVDWFFVAFQHTETNPHSTP
jgi:hypothetical protein